MSKQPSTLSADSLRAHYDRFGRRQDRQAWYEDKALECLIANADFASARSVFEFGCGTGRFAARLLGEVMPADAHYLGVDISDTMVRLARERVGRFGPRAKVIRNDGAIVFPVAPGSLDRVIATYVTDLLTKTEIDQFMTEAHRCLCPGGLICLAGLTTGRRGLARVVSAAWTMVHKLSPLRVGGCRPRSLAPLLSPPRWQLKCRRTVSSLALSSEILVAAADHSVAADHSAAADNSAAADHSAAASATALGAVPGSG